MALIYTELWAADAAGTMAASLKRDAGFVRGVMYEAANAIYWSDDGTQAGSNYIGENSVPPLSWAMMASDDADGGWSPRGIYGPVVDASGGGAASIRDLFFLLIERQGSLGNSTTIYSGGPDSGGYVQLQGQGRSFFCFVIG